jgi:hypothetical protein
LGHLGHICDNRGGDPSSGGDSGPSRLSWPSQSAGGVSQLQANNVQGYTFDKIQLAASTKYIGELEKVKSFLTQLQLHFLA